MRSIPKSLLGLTAALGFFHVSSAFQIPFFNRGSDNVEPAIHFSSLSENEHPIDLLQYSNSKVIRVNYGNNKELYEYLLLKKVDTTIWSKSASSKYVDVQLSDSELIKLLDLYDVDYKVLIDDLAQTIFETYPENHKLSINSEGSPYKYAATEEIIRETKANIFSEIFFKDYRPLEAIDAWLDLIELSFPNVIKIETIGETYEKRPYKIIHFSDHISDDHSTKKTVVISGGIHAREWISVSSVCYQLYSMLQELQANPEILDQLDFIFIPVSNPDGYEYSWNNDRLWRKNRQPTVLPRCFGIDIDHSYDFHWSKSSDWPCGEEYSGEEPYAALEAQIWEQYLNRTNGDHQIYGYIDLHSYSEEILFPFAYSCNSEPRDEENLIELAYGISKAIRLQSDLGSGTTLDFMYHNKAFWAYQLKLRDTGNHGFLLPPKFIEPVGAEVFAGILYFLRFITSDD